MEQDRQFACRVSAPGEAVSLPFTDVAAPGGDAVLVQLLEEHGYAIVTGCVDQEGLDRLEAAWNTDIASLIEHNSLADQDAVRQVHSRFLREGAASLPLSTAHELTHPDAGMYT